MASQSATSEALGRLRELLEDPLLVQVGRSMRLTPRAEDLIEPLERLCHDAEGLLETAPFDPAVSQRNFRIGASDFGITEIGPIVLELRRRHAPLITVSFLDFHHSSLDRLASRDLDFAWLATFFLEDSGLSSLRSVPLGTHRLVVVFDGTHPLAGKERLEFEDLKAWPMIGIELEPGLFKHGRLEALQGGLRVKPAVTVPHATLQPHLVQGSDCWALVPACTAERVQRELGLAVREAPFFDLSPGGVCLAWSMTHDSDPAHRWFRETMVELVRENHLSV